MTDWDKCWREGQTPWDKGGPAPPLDEYLDERQGVDGLRILVPGCGSGHDVRRLAAAGASVLALDLSPTAIETARRFPAIGDERYEVGDFFEHAGEPFDMIWEHTCFCAIEPGCRDDYRRASARLLRPGGRLVGVFFLDPWEAGEKPDPPPYGVRREELLERFEPGFELAWSKVPQRAYPGREGREWLAEFVRRDGGVAEQGEDR